VLLTDADEGVHTAVDLLGCVRGGELDADARLALRNDGVGEADDVDPLGQEVGGHVLGQARLVEHDGHDGVHARLDVEARFGHPRAEADRVFLQSVAQRRGAFEHVQHR